LPLICRFSSSGVPVSDLLSTQTSLAKPQRYGDHARAAVAALAQTREIELWRTLDEVWGRPD